MADKILDKINQQTPEEPRKSKRLNITLPAKEYDYLLAYKDKKEYPSVSYTILRILEQFFENL